MCLVGGEVDMNEQLSLFSMDSSDSLVFYGHYCNEDWSAKTKTADDVENIVDSIKFNLTKSELKKLCQNAKEVFRDGIYGYTVQWEENRIKKELFVRFINFKTSPRRNVMEHIELYFEEEVRWLKR